MKRWTRRLFFFLLLLCSALFLAPILFVVTGSLMGTREFSQTYGIGTMAFPRIVPSLATFEQYGALLFNTPSYLMAYWNSLFIATSVCVLQLLFALPCAYGFAKLRFRLSNGLYFAYIVMMMMPFQVTMLPMYQMMKWLNLYNTSWSLIVPEIFAPFTVFLLTQSMTHLPDELIESVRLESSSSYILFRYLIIPLSKPGIVSAMVLSFVETWNLVEKPLLYLTDSLHSAAFHAAL